MCLPLSAVRLSSCPSYFIVGFFDLSQISPDSGLCDLCNSLPFLPYVLFCLCRPRHELLPLNVIDAELVSFGQWSLLQCTILVIYVSVPARFCLTTALPANTIWLQLMKGLSSQNLVQPLQYYSLLPRATSS